MSLFQQLMYFLHYIVNLIIYILSYNYDVKLEH